LAYPQNKSEPTLSDQLRTISRWKWLIILVVVATTVSAFAFSYTRTSWYKATAQLMYQQPLDVSNPLLGTSTVVNPEQIKLELQGVGSIVKSAEMRGRVAEIVGLSASDPQLRSVTTSVLPDSSVVEITAESTDSRQAARVANAFALAFTDSMKEIERARVDQAERVIRNKLKSFTNAA
jgi:uncharacterized protein involved in exopolysaccharide biosynthesis